METQRPRVLDIDVTWAEERRLFQVAGGVVVIDEFLRQIKQRPVHVEATPQEEAGARFFLFDVPAFFLLLLLFGEVRRRPTGCCAGVRLLVLGRLQEARGADVLVEVRVHEEERRAVVLWRSGKVEMNSRRPR